MPIEEERTLECGTFFPQIGECQFGLLFTPHHFKYGDLQTLDELSSEYKLNSDLLLHGNNNSVCPKTF